MRAWWGAHMCAPKTSRMRLVTMGACAHRTASATASLAFALLAARQLDDLCHPPIGLLGRRLGDDWLGARERAEQADLLAHHLADAPDSLADVLLGHPREVEPHRGRPAPVEVGG